jgi:hypothetical protein
MILSIFLAKLLGIYMLIAAAELVLRRREVESAMREMAHCKGFLAYSGSVSLLLGLAIVIAHPVYDKGWRELITLIGYILVIRGVIRCAFSAYYQKKFLPFYHQKYRAVFLILLVVGLYLTYMGFTAVPEMPM